MKTTVVIYLDGDPKDMADFVVALQRKQPERDLVYEVLTKIDKASKQGNPAYKP